MIKKSDLTLISMKIKTKNQIIPKTLEKIPLTKTKNKTISKIISQTEISPPTKPATPKHSKDNLEPNFFTKSQNFIAIHSSMKKTLSPKVSPNILPTQILTHESST
jgi:hypothetical protein